MAEFDDENRGKLPQDKLSEIAGGGSAARFDTIGGGRRLSTADRLLQEYMNSPSFKMARDLYDSPTARLAREIADSPTARNARELAESPTARRARALADTPAARLAQSMTVIRPLAIEHSKIAELGAEVPTAIDRKLLEAVTGAGPLAIDTRLASAVERAQASLQKLTQPLGGAALAFAKFEAQQSKAQKAIMASLVGPIGGLARTAQWASVIGAVEQGNVAKLFNEQVADALDRIRASVLGTLGATAAHDQTRIGAMLGLSARYEADFAATQLKMSALAGIAETFSLKRELRLDAYHALFGAWRTRPDLPESYWHDGRVRRRMYREAEVDDGLADATPGVALEVMIDSGLATGMRSEANAVAIVTLGEVSMTIRSRGTRKDAYAVLERFEEELRAFVARKLEARFGPDWFKARASNLIGKAKAIRRAAMERGEAFAPLINFIELGELAGLVLASKNWDEVFGEIFINHAEFDHDMQKLIAARRPTMHVRTIDGVRLVELICVVQRLSKQMTEDGAWKARAEFDH